MRKIVQSVVIHTVVGIIIFAAAFFLFNQHISKGEGQDYSEMSNSTYPVMEIQTDNGDYNVMNAYLDPIDLSLVRNQITTVGSDGTLNLCLHNYDYDITAIQYVLFTDSEDNPLEDGTLNQLDVQKEAATKTGTIHFNTNIEKGKTYYLKLAARLNSSTRVFFYTKIQNADGYHLGECMDFAIQFHNNLFDKTDFQNDVSYLEPSADNKITSMESVDIHSSTEAVSFGNMTVKQESDPVFTLKEINEVYVVLQMDCILSSEISDGVIQYYDVTENYKIRYTSDRMYLLDYNRTMDAYYNKALNDPSQNYITLGIQNSDHISYMSSDKGYKVCFSQEGQLWYYDYNSSDVAKVYSFASENLADLRNNNDSHDIKILQMDDDGNITYIVYGYMNRGHYEGKNGIQLLKYNAEEKCNVELAFFATSIPFSRMKNDVEKLVYLDSEENVFYCLLDGDLHAVDLNKRKDSILKSNMINESITASRDQSIIAIEDNQDLTQNTCIYMMDLSSGKEQKISCNEDKRIRSVGFLSNDFIYGTASAANVKKNDGNVLTFPMSKLSIVNIDGEKIKDYSKKNRYILDTDITGNVLEMKFGRKSGNHFSSTSDIDYIRYKEEESEGSVKLVYDYSYTYWNQLFISFPSYVYIQVEPDLVLTKVLASDNDMLISLERSNASSTQYYVYAEGKEQEVYDNLMQAIVSADELRGSVISSNEKLMWECGFDDYAMVAGMDQVTKVKSSSKSLAGCLQMIAKVNGKQPKLSEISTTDKSVTELVAEYSGCNAYNISGCTVDEALYFISQGSPVLAKYNSKKYVILMSYNSSKIRYLDPVTGQSTAVDRSTLTSTLSKAGNKFYTYLAE